jgi:hypothetical protein
MEFENPQFLKVHFSCSLAFNNSADSWYSLYTTSYPLLLLEISEESAIANCFKMKMAKSTSSRKEWCSEILTRLIFPLRFSDMTRRNFRMVSAYECPVIFLLRSRYSRWMTPLQSQKNVVINIHDDRVEGGVRGGGVAVFRQPFVSDLVGRRNSILTSHHLSVPGNKNLCVVVEGFKIHCTCQNSVSFLRGIEFMWNKRRIQFLEM